ncbi:MAG: putative aminohydrolase SsnA [Kiritimatiellae bacterium]|jgi:putative selenium metabolism protein SsnA|nr:putative aminohydrolase SsnA [Kiritimatiellia bacterium]MDD4342095.1 putative aminohydrolase SsnA [Kiritimatiellia bacterium]MDY0149322.1 putative aminohydrolase SsnA [Kiritimatiellia bacterium]
MAQKKSNALLITNGIVVTLGEHNRIINDGAVLVVDGVIEAVGKAATVKKKARGARVLNAKGRVIMPGFINAHMHLYSTYCRGLTPKQPPATNFVEVLERLWWPLDKALNAKDIHYSSLVPLIDCIKNGTTTIIDHHESQDFQTGSLAVIEKACRKAGVRSVLTLGLSDRYGKGEEGIQENVQFIKKIQAKRQKGDDLISAMMGLHALFTVNEESLKKSCDLANELDCGMHVHIAEAKADQDANKKQYGKSVIERLHAAGGLGPKTLAIHCVHVSNKEIGLMAKTGTCAVHNPESNMNNAVGVAPVTKMMDKGVLVGLGTDAMTTDMKAEVRIANIFHKHAAKNSQVFFLEACAMLMNNNAQIASRFFNRPVGELKKGSYGDVVVMDYDPPTPMNDGTFLGHYLFGICAARVDSTIVNGKVLMEGGKLTTINEPKINAESRKQAADYWKRF